MGVCNQLFNVRLKNIGAAANSWGYSSSGKKGEGKDGFVPYGAPYTTGDVIAMLVDTMTGTVRYSKNGEDQGIAFRGLEAESLHAAVCGGGGVEGDLHEIQALEVPRVFDPSTKKGGLRAGVRTRLLSCSCKQRLCEIRIRGVPRLSLNIGLNVRLSRRQSLHTLGSVAPTPSKHQIRRKPGCHQA